MKIILNLNVVIVYARNVQTIPRRMASYRVCMPAKEYRVCHICDVYMYAFM
jgi:hypothetical protein